MLDWLKRRLAPTAPARDPVAPDDAMQRLRQVVSDAAFEDVWEAMDFDPAGVEPMVREAIAAGELGDYPRHAALIWLGQTVAATGRLLEPQLHKPLQHSVLWALAFDENTVLLGAALGALDSLPDEERANAACRLFSEAGAAKPRRYWLLLKVRTPAMMDLIVEALGDYEDAPTADPDDEDFIYSPTAANRMAGAFRQFQPQDFELARDYFDLSNPGAQFLVEALGATQNAGAVPLLREALADPRPDVSSAAARWLRVISG